MDHGLSISQSGAFDFVSLGALVHRLDPGIVPFRKATECQIHVSGGEYNCAANLADCFGLGTAVVSAMVDYPIGDLIATRVRAMGVKGIYKALGRVVEDRCDLADPRVNLASYIPAGALTPPARSTALTVMTSGATPSNRRHARPAGRISVIQAPAMRNWSSQSRTEPGFAISRHRARTPAGLSFVTVSSGLAGGTSGSHGEAGTSAGCALICRSRVATRGLLRSRLLVL